MCHRRNSNGTRRTPNVSTKAFFRFKVFPCQVFFFFLFISMELTGTCVLRILCANLGNPGRFEVRNERMCDCSRKRDRKMKRVMAKDRTITSIPKMNST